MSDYHKDGKLGFERNITILTMQVTRLEEQLKYARECNKVKDKYWDKIRIERNGFVLDITELQDRVKELETELYFCNRNKRVGEVVDERTKMETPKIKL
jgi:hypothetical protein